MKKILLLPAILIVSLCHAQVKTKPDTLAEKDLVLISQLLNFGETAAGNSEKVSTAQYNQYHAQVAHIDSVLREMWVKWHPVKASKK